MLPSQYQRFVAWRYLLERERKLSSAILWVVGTCLWVCIGMAAASLLYPLSDSFMVPGPEIPPIVPTLLGLSIALPVIAALVCLVDLFRQLGTRYLSNPGSIAANQKIEVPIGWATLIIYWSLVALAMVGFYSSITQEADWAVKYSWAAGPLFAVTFGLPITLSIIVAWSRGQQPGAVLSDIASGSRNVFYYIVAGTIAALLKRDRSPLFKILLVLQVLTIVPVLTYLAYFCVSHIAWSEMMGHGLLKVIAFTSLIVAVVSSVGFGVFRKKIALGMGVLAIGVTFFCFALVSYFELFRVVSENIKFLGGWDKYTPPMDFIIPSYAAGALFILALVLLIVRYFFTFFTTVSIGGVTIGTMALVIVLSVMSGFENDLRGKILGFNAHIQISRNDELQFKGYQEVQEVLDNTPSVVGYTPFLITEAYMSNHNNYGNVTMKGIDPSRVAGVTEIVVKLEKGDERALEKIWPLSEDGSILGKPAPKAKDDSENSGELPSLDGGPVDYSGGLDVIEDEEVQLDLGELVDYSGGLDEIPPDAGVPDAGTIPQDSGIGLVAPEDGDAGPSGSAREIRKAPLDPIIDGEWQTQLLPDDFIKPEIATLDGVLVGRELVKQISLYTGQEVRVISPLPDVSPDGLSIPRIKNYRIAGKFFSGMYEYDLKYVYCSLESLQRFLDLEDVVNGIEVRVSDPTKTGAIVKRLQRELGEGYRVQDWKELNKALFSALKLEKIAMFFVLVIIVLVASFSIVGNLIMVVIEKAKEIAILKTLGSSNTGVMKVFIIQGFFIGLVGTGLGLGLGLGACYLGMVYGVPLDPDVYYIDKLPILIDPVSVATVGFAGIAISVLATIYPAFIAARMRPVKGLRWD